jgi:PAS domain S-box-containing protein
VIERSQALSSPLLLFARLAPEIAGRVQAALLRSPRFALLGEAAVSQLSHRLLSGLEHALSAGDCASLLAALGQSTLGPEAMRLGTLADAQGLISVLRRAVFDTVRDLPEERPPDVIGLCDRVTDSLTQVAALDAQRRLSEMQGYALLQAQRSESMEALSGAQSYGEAMDITVRYLATLDVARCSLWLLHPASTTGSSSEPAAPAHAEIVGSWARGGAAALPVGMQLTVDETPLGTLLTADEQLVWSDILREPGVPQPLREYLLQLGVQSVLSAPLYLRDRLLGRLLMGWTEPRHLPFHHQRLLSAIIEQTATVMSRLRLLEESAQRYRELATLRDRLTELVAEQTAALRTFKALADHAPDGIAVTNQRGSRLAYANRAFRELMQLPEDSVGLPTREHFEETDERLREIMDVITTAGAWQGRMHYRRSDGEVIPAQVSSFSVPGEDGEQIALASIVRDVRDQQRAEAERLRLREQVIEAQRATLRTLATPVIPLAEGVIVTPLLGTLDEERGQMIIESLLDGVTAARAHTVILDVTGVTAVDPSAVVALLRAARAIRLLGAQAVLTGLRPQVAQALVQGGEDLSGLSTMATLQSAVARAFRRGLR